MKTYRLFISHSWRYSNAYESLCNLLTGRGYFRFMNYSAPAHKPLTIDRTSAREMDRRIADKLRPCHAMLVLAGVYASYSDWIPREITIAQNLGKPVIGIAHWGANRTSKVVQQGADVVVRWNENSVVNAIRTYGITPM